VGVGVESGAQAREQPLDLVGPAPVAQRAAAEEEAGQVDVVGSRLSGATPRRGAAWRRPDTTGLRSGRSLGRERG